MFEHAFETPNELGKSITIVRKPDPDLQVTTGGVDPIFARPGDAVTLSWSVKNAGPGIAEAPWIDRIYLLPDGVGVDQLPSAAVRTINVSQAAQLAPHVPGETEPSYDTAVTFNLTDEADGLYQVVVESDAVNDVFEGFTGSMGETNNRRVVGTLEVGHPNLRPIATPIQSIPTAGDTFTIEWTVGNIGTAGATSPWIDRVYLSTNNILDASDTLLASLPHVENLSSEADYGSQLQVLLPIELAGQYFILVETDADDQVLESNRDINHESDNVSAIQIEIAGAPYADLSVKIDAIQGEPLNLPEIIGDPAEIQVSWTVTNLLGTSTGSTNSDVWTDLIVASQDSVIGNSDDVFLKEFTHIGVLQPGENYSREEIFLLPPALKGRFRLFVVTDSSNDVFENNLDANNIQQAPDFVDVMPTPYADLVTRSVAAPATAFSGEGISISWSVENQGIGLTSRSSWSDRVVIARNPNGSDVVTSGTFDHIGHLAVGSSYNRSAQLTLPNGQSGTFFAIVTTASGNGPFEFIYTANNRRVSDGFVVELANSPDLVVSNIEVPDSAFESERIDVSWTVSNQGTADAITTWIDTVFLRPAGNLSGPKINLGSFTYSASLEAGKKYERQEQLPLPARLNGLFELVVVTNASATLYEHAEAAENNSSFAPLSVSLRSRPDLQISSMEAPDRVPAGGTASVKFFVTNQSTVGTPPGAKWKDRVYLSLDANISSDDILVGTFDNAAALTAAGEIGDTYMTSSDPFVIPKRFRGTVYVIATTDIDDQVDEWPRDANNTSVRSLFVEPLPFADLVTSDVVAPLQVIEGIQIDVSYTVTNRGSGPTLSDSGTQTWNDTIWFTRDKNRPHPGQGDILLGSYVRQGPLFIDGADGPTGYDSTETVTLPKGLASGIYYITVWTDSFNVILEDTLASNINPDDPNEIDNNNYKARALNYIGFPPSSPSPPPFVPPSDLVVAEIQPTVQAFGGEPFTVLWTVQNLGPGATPVSSWQDRVILSDSPNLNTPGATTRVLGSVSHSGTLALNESYTSELTVTLSPAASGMYIIVQTDTSDQVKEQDETNNTLTAATDVTPVPAELVVQSVVTPSKNFSGETTSIAWTVKNEGNNQVWSGTNYWIDRVWISPDPIVIPRFERGKLVIDRATFLGDFPYIHDEPLDPNATYTQNRQVTLPRGIGGTYYIHVFTNVPPNKGAYEYETLAYETDTNNLKTASIPVTYYEADLQVKDLNVPQNASSGSTIPVSFTVENRGGRDTRQANWVDRLFLSDDPSLDSGDILLAEKHRNTILEAGQSYTSTLEFILPDGIQGDFYILAFVDSNISEGRSGLTFDSDPVMARVQEYQDEGNNIASQALPITLATPPDLRVTSLVAPARALIGESVDVTYTVANLGAGATPERQSNWSDLIYLSRDDFLDLQADRFLAEHRHTGGIAAEGLEGDRYQVTTSVRIPSDLEGPFFVFVITDPARGDARGQVFEGAVERNNNRLSPIVIDVPPPTS